MSNFSKTVINKETGEKRQALFIDNYFGWHKYGVVIADEKGRFDFRPAITIKALEQEWERVEKAER